MNENIEIQEQESSDPTNKKNFIALVLDRSSSMFAIKDQAIGLFNEQLDTIILESEKTGIETKISLITFSTEVDKCEINLEKPSEINKLTKESYIPGGLTALYDAIGAAIVNLQSVKYKENEDVSFLIVIVTDGEENNSKEHQDGSKLSAIIKDLQDKGNWTFSVLGSNIDLNQLQAKLGFSAGNISNFTYTPDGLTYASTVTSNAMSNFYTMRRNGQRSMTSFYSSINNDDETTPSANNANLSLNVSVDNPN